MSPKLILFMDNLCLSHNALKNVNMPPFLRTLAAVVITSVFVKDIHGIIVYYVDL